MSHSPFPWSIHPQVPNAVFDADGKKIVWCGPPSNYPSDPETAEDDAALIAAIPAMIEVLQEISVHRCPRQNGGWKTSSAASAARAVLASIGKMP